MTKEEIIDMARQAGCIPRRHPEYWEDVQVFATPDVLVAFAELVAVHTLMNIDPSKFISYQDGIEAGRFSEREACAKEVENALYGQEGCGKAAKAIRARGGEA